MVVGKSDDRSGGVPSWLGQIQRTIDSERFAVEVMETHGDSLWIKLCSHILQPLWIAWKFRQALRGRDPYDVIHVSSSLWDAGLLSRLACSAGIPVRIAHSHIPKPGHGRVWRGPLWRALLRKWTLRYATHLLGVSTEAAVGQLGPEAVCDPRFSLCPAAIDLTPFREPVCRDDIRESLGIPPGASVVGHVGRFTSEKNHGFILQVAVRVLERREDIIFMLVGDGRGRPEVEQQIRTLGVGDRFRLTGARADVPALMKGAMDVLLFPSEFEGLPRVVLEAQAAGLPCVLSDVISEETDVVKPLIKRLSLLDPPESWAESVLRALDDGPAITPEAALKAMEASTMNIETSARELEAIYASCRH